MKGNKSMRYTAGFEKKVGVGQTVKQQYKQYNINKQEEPIFSLILSILTNMNMKPTFWSF